MKDKRNLATFQQTLCGNVYQLKIILIFLWRASKLNKFLLGTELPWGEKFDDVIFYFENDEKNFVRYLQAKHVRYDGTTFKYEDIVTDWEKAPCNIKKYFISYRKIKQRISQEKIKDLILCTNICFKNLVLKKDTYNKLEFEEVSSSINDDIFNDSKTKEAWKKYQLKSISNELEESLQSCTNLNMLAEELADYLFKEQKDPKLDLTNYWISSYFATLMEQGIIQFQEVYRFANPNAETDQQKKKNDEIKELQNFYIAEVKEKRGKNVVPKELENFTFKKEFIDKLKRTKKASNDLAKLAEVLAGGTASSVKFNNINNVLRNETEYVFTDNFINGTDDTTKGFCSILLKHCKTKIAEKLGAFEFSIDSTSTPLNQLPTTTEFDENTSTMIAKEFIDNIFYDKQFTSIIEENWHLLKDIFHSSKKNMFKFTRNFVKYKNEKHHEFRHILFEMYVKETLKKERIKFKQNISNFSKLAETIKNAYKKAKIHKSDTLKFSQNELKEVKGYLEALNNTVFVASNQRNKIMFKNGFFKSPHAIAADFVNELRNQKFTPHEMQDLKNYSIEYANFPPYFNTLDEMDAMKDEIEEFLKLFFIINTPNEKQLLNDISIELGEKFNLLDPMLLTNDLFQIIIEWAKNNENAMIDKDKAIEFIDNLQTKLSTYWIAGCSTQYCKKLEEYSITFNTPLNDIMMFLNALPSEHAKILHIATNETLLTAIKVMQALKSTKIYNKKDSFIFNPLSLLLQMEYPLEKGLEENHISNTFQSIADLLIVVDCETKKDFKPFCEKLCNILHEKPKKKIIVIGSKESAFASALINAQHFSQQINDETKFNDLTPDSKTSIRRNSNVLFQGRNVSLNDLIDENDFDDLIDAETLQTMMTGDEIIIGKPVATFSQSEKDNYHPRKFYLINFQKTILEDTTLTDSHIFALEGTGNQELIDKRNSSSNSNIRVEPAEMPPLKKMDTPKCVLLDPSQAKNQFKKLCQKNQNYFIHWVKFQDNQLIWFHSYVPDSKQLSSQFFDSANRKEKSVDESFFYDYVKQNQNVIISDKAGMGKSTVLTNFSEILFDNQQWKIRINLNQYTDTLLEIKKSALRKDDLYLNFDNFDNDYENLILKSIVSSKSCTNEKLTFANRMFNYFFQKRGIFYIFDGFDEINPNYGSIVLTILQMLRKNIKNRIWIASRTNFKKKLELKFNTFAYDMMPFNKNDQKEYLIKFWSNNWRRKKGYDIPNVARLKLYIEKMIKELSAVMGDIIGIPLQTKMLAEIFQENRSKEKIWQSCFDFVDSNVPIENLDFSNHVKNIFQLYEEFFNQKLFRYFLHEKRIVDFSKPYAADDLKPMISFYEKPAHQIFGILAFDEKNAFKEVLVENEKVLQNSWMTSFKKGGKNIGLIDIFNKRDIPIFNHFTYAEYFCACFLIEKLCSSPSHAKQVFKIADKIFEKDVPVFMECFLYKLKQQFDNKELQTGLKGRTVLKFAIDYGLLNCVNVFLNSNDFNDNFLNESGQTVIDYAIEREQIMVVIYIILYISDLMDAAKLPNYHFMYYLSKFICNSDEQSNESSSSISNWSQIDLQAFLKEIKEIGEIQVKPKDTTTEMAKITEIYRYRCLQRKYFVSNAAKVFLDLPNILKYLSYDSIMLILDSYNYSISDCIDFISHVAILRYDEDDNKKFKIIKRIIDECEEEIERIFLIIVYSDSINLLQMLLQHYSITESTVRKCIFTACSNDNIEIIEILLKYINPNVNEWETTNLDFAEILKANFKTVEYLLNRINVPVNQLDINDKTILCSAVDFPGTMEIIEYLVEKKNADPFLRLPAYISPWLFALKNKKKKIIKYFKSKKDVHHITENQKISWHQISKNGEIPDNDTLFIVNGINDKDNNGNTPLHIAVQRNSDNIVEWLLRRGANFEATNKDGKTAEAYEDMKSILKDTRETFGCIMGQPNFKFEDDYYMKTDSHIYYAKDKLGRTILHYAVINRNTYTIKNIVEFCDIEEEDNENKSPLFYAVKSNDFEIVKILVNYECLTKFKIPEIPENSCTVFLLQTDKCLELLKSENFKELKNELKNFNDIDCFNAGIRISCPYSSCILDYASTKYDLMIYLLQCGLNISQFSQNKLDEYLYLREHRFNQRMEIVRHKVIEFAKYFSDQNIDSESLLQYYENTLSKTVGHLLFITDKNEVEKILINVRLDCNEYKGVTLLHLAAIADVSNLTIKLINAGANPNARDSIGNTVYSLARQKNSLNVIRLLDEFEKAKKDASSALPQI